MKSANAKMADEEQLEKEQEQGTSQFDEEEEEEEEEEDSDFLFRESDSDADSDSDFNKDYSFVEADRWQMDYTLYDEKEEGRKCLELPLCHRLQHKAGFCGTSVFELFKVRLKFNDKLIGNKPFINARLYGEIVTLKTKWDPDNPVPINYYRVSPLEPDLVNLDDSDNKFTLLPLSGANPRPAFYDDYALGLVFAFKIDDEDMFTGGEHHLNRKLLGNCVVNAGVDYLPSYAYSHLGSCRTGPYIARKVFGNPGCDRVLLSAQYSKYRGAWATIEVKMLKEGVRGFYGLIAARPCIFFSRIRLLTIQRDNEKRITIQRDEKGKVESDGCIKLSRSVVAVPSISSLIVGAVLFGEDGESLICRGKTYFPAKESGVETKCISYDDVETLRVTVNWKSEL